VASVYPTNLEIVNAIVPLIASQGGIGQHATILDRIVDWLMANKRSIHFSGGAVTGWSAGLHLDRGRVDVWLTAIALEFLVCYRELVIDFMVQKVSETGCDTQWPKALSVQLHTLVTHSLQRLPKSGSRRKS